MAGIISCAKAHGKDLKLTLFENVLGLAIPPSLPTVEGGVGKKIKETIHESNLAVTLFYLGADASLFSFATVLDPRCFGSPQSRGRFWMPGFHHSLLQEEKFSEKEAYDWTCHFLERFNGHGYSSLDDILLPADHPMLVRQLALAREKPCPWEDQIQPETDEAGGNKKPLGEKWPTDHLSWARRIEGYQVVGEVGSYSNMIAWLSA